MNKEAQRMMEEEVSNIDLLKHLRHDHIDKIPEQIIKLGDPDYYRYKCRKNWWNGVIGTLEMMKMDREIPHFMHDNVNNFIRHYASDEFSNQKLVTRDDILRANTFLDTLIYYTDPNTNVNKHTEPIIPRFSIQIQTI